MYSGATLQFLMDEEFPATRGGRVADVVIAFIYPPLHSLLCRRFNWPESCQDLTPSQARLGGCRECQARGICKKI